MGLNFAGVGFSFGGKDAGLKKSQDNAAKGFDKVNKSVDGINKSVSTNRLSTFIQSVSLGQLNSINDKLRTITGTGGTLTNSLEAMTTANDKTARAFGANSGLMGKDLSKFSGQVNGLAIGLNVSAETAAKAQLEWTKYAEVLRYAGIDSAATLIKLGEVTGIEAGKLVDLADTAKVALKWDENQFQGVISSFTSLGQQTGSVSRGIEFLDSTMNALADASGELGKQLNPQDLLNFAKGTAGLTAGLFKVSGNFDQAKATVEGLNTAILGTFTDFERMKLGEGEFSDFANTISMQSGTVQAAFEAMKKGPAEFVTGLSEMVQAAKNSQDAERSLSYLEKTLSKVVGGDANAAKLTGFLKVLDKETAAVMASTMTATIGLKKVGDQGHTTGRTLQESFDMALERLETKFRSISKGAASKYVSNTSAQFDSLGDKVKELAQDNGPLGMLVEKFSLVHSLGAKALLPEQWQAFAGMIGGAVTTITPVVGALGALGFRFTMLTSPIALATGAIVGWLFVTKNLANRLAGQDKAYAKQAKSLEDLEKKLRKIKKGTVEFARVEEKVAKQREKLAEMHKPFEDQARKATIESVKKGVITAIDWAKALIKDLPKIWTAIKTEFDSFPWADIWKGLQDVWDMIPWDKIIPVVEGAAEKAWAIASDFLTSLWAGLIGGVDPAGEGASKANKLGAKIGEALKKAFDYVLDTASQMLSTWWAKMGSIWADDSTTFTDKIKSTFSNAGTIALIALFGSSISALVGIAGSLLHVAGLAAVGVFKLGESLWDVGVKRGPQIAQGFSAVTSGIGGLLSKMGNSTLVVASYVRVWSPIKEFFTTAAIAVGAFATSIWTKALPALKAFGKGAMLLMTSPHVIALVAAFAAAKGIEYALGKATEKYVDTNIQRTAGNAKIIRDATELEKYQMDVASAMARGADKELTDLGVTFTKTSQLGAALNLYNGDMEKALKRLRDDCGLTRAQFDALDTAFTTFATRLVTDFPGVVNEFGALMETEINATIEKTKGLFDKVWNGVAAGAGEVPVDSGKTAEELKGLAKLTGNLTVASIKVELDGKETSDVLAGAASRISVRLGEMLNATVEASLTSAFTKGLGTVEKKLTSFTDGIRTQMNKLADDVALRMYKLWKALVYQSGVGADEITANLGRILPQLEAMSNALIKTRDMSQPGGVNTVNVIRPPALGAKANDDDLYKAIHDPAWAEQYSRDFKYEMALLRSEIQQLRGSVASGGRRGNGFTGKVRDSNQDEDKQ